MTDKHHTLAPSITALLEAQALNLASVQSKKIAVLMGGWSHEAEVSKMSGQGVLEALQSAGLQALAFDPATHNLFELKSLGIDIAAIHLHGRYGEDGCVQGALECLDIPYTGSGVMASSIAIDKAMTKRIWQTYGLTTPQYAVVHSEAEALQAAQAIPAPWAVKPAREGSSIGFSRVNQLAGLAAAYHAAAQKDTAVLIEQFIAGPEFTVSLIQHAGKTLALPVIQILAPAGQYDYQNKYYTDVVKYECPAKIDTALTQTMQALAIKAFDLLDCKTWGRVDMMLDSVSQTPYLLEVNTSPGMTSHSLVPMAAQAIGLSYSSLCIHLIANACVNQVKPTIDGNNSNQHE